MNKLILLLILFSGAAYFSCRFSAGDKGDRHAAFARDYLPASVTDTFYLNAANPFTKEKAELGRYLFYDRRLSVNNTKACASCHAPQFSFTDGYTRSIGALGDLHQRNARPLINIIFLPYLTAADSTLHFPEQQMNNPMMSEHPVELGIKDNEKKILDKIKSDPFYAARFKKIFPGDDDPFSIKNIQYCIAGFIRTITAFNSPYDRYLRGDSAALDAQQQAGMRLFFSGTLHCGSCHGGINFSTPAKDSLGKRSYYFNTGIYNLDGKGGYPAYDQGLIAVTHDDKDMGLYRVPTLRNLPFTAPYYHDGSALTIDEVIAAYARGGRNMSEGVYKGDGAQNVHKSGLIKGFDLTSQQRKQLVAFLYSLADSTVINNPAFADPYKEDETKNYR